MFAYGTDVGYSLLLPAGESDSNWAISSGGDITYLGTAKADNTDIVMTAIAETNTSSTDPATRATATATVTVQFRAGTLASQTISWPTPASWTGGAYRFSQAENVAVPLELGTILPTVSAGGGALTLEVEGSEFFSWTEAGVLSLTTGLDYETAQSQTAILKATAAATSTAREVVSRRAVILTVTDVEGDLVAPVFARDSYAFTLIAGNNGSSNPVDVGIVQASAPEGDITYAITAGNTAGKFAIGSTTGAITYIGTGETADADDFALTIAATATEGTATAMSNVAVSVDVIQATGAPSFDAADAAVNLPSGTDGGTSAYSLGAYTAGQGASYSVDDSLVGSFAVDEAGELTYIGTAADAIVGNSWTVTITATNPLGSDTIEILVTVKAVITIAFTPAAPDWKLPVGQAGPVVLGSLSIGTNSNDVRGLPPVPTLTASGDDAQFVSVRPTADRTFEVSYTGEAATLATSDLAFVLTASTVENGLCLPATGSLDLSVPSVPQTPEFNDADGYVYDIADGYDPPPAEIVGLPTATHAAGESQRWRIITAQTGTRLFAIDAATGAISYTGPDAADRSVAASYSFQLGVVNIDGSKESIEGTQTATVIVSPAYAPPVENGNWNPGSTWTKAADGSWHGTIQTGSANSVSIDIAAGMTGPYAIQTGLTASYDSHSVPSPPTDFSVSQAGSVFTIIGISAGSETLYLLLSDGTTQERLVFHIQVAAAATESV